MELNIGKKPENLNIKYTGKDEKIKSEFLSKITGCKKSRTVEFIGTPSGDGESFCWDVDEENYKIVTGKEPDEFDYFLDNLYLYPDDIFEPKYIFNDNKEVIGIEYLKKCKIKICYEELE